MEKAKDKAEKRNLPLRIMFQDEARFGRINEIKKMLGTNRNKTRSNKTNS